jgi:outer membrane protein OmpA-like peptidoglycan-associated protein
MTKLHFLGFYWGPVLLCVATGCRHEPQHDPGGVPPESLPHSADAPVAAAPGEEWVRFPNTISYRVHEASVPESAREQLRELRDRLVQDDVVRVRVAGAAHGESSDEANDQLGLARAEAVVDYFVDQLGLRRDLFEVESYGNRRPLAYVTEADRPEPERVEIMVLIRP